MHFSIISLPGELIFDEHHYVPDARSILDGEGTLRLEHPPLGRLFITAGISLFGDNPLGWRFFSVIFGAIVIVLFYLICRRLSLSKTISFLATFLLALENLVFVQASVAMLDVYSLAFILTSFWLYLRGNYLPAGISVGLAALTKLDGALALGVILLHWLIARRDRYRTFISLLILAPASFVFLMPLFDFIIFQHFVNPFERIITILSLSSSLTFDTVSHSSAMHPWEWILGFQQIPYWYEPNYFGTIGYSILPLIIPSVVYMIVRAIKRSDAGLFGLLWFISTYLVWILVSIIANRVTYVYYFHTTIGAICLGLGLVLAQLINFWKTRETGKLRWIAISVVSGYLLFHIAVFAFLSPISYWWGIPFIK